VPGREIRNIDLPSGHDHLSLWATLFRAKLHASRFPVFPVAGRHHCACPTGANACLTALPWRGGWGIDCESG